MKKIITLFLSLFVLTVSAWAVVAPKTPYPYKQPDGTVIMLVNHGDEFFNWTTCNGQVVVKDASGYYRPAISTLSMEKKAQAAKVKRQQANEAYKAAADGRLGMGEKHFMVLLVEFDDLPFTIDNPKEAFEKLLNQPGYAENGGTGSVKDFYEDNSLGQFKPTFDVYGPVKVPKSYAYYGAPSGDDHDAHPQEALYDACVVLDETTDFDFSKYDLDGDGYVDNVFFYYAGHNQAEGGGEDTIWPHKWSMYQHYGVFDGVRVYNYACSSEYRGSEGSDMAGIGTFTHEFGHVIGLPDFYDIDYAKHGQAPDAPGNFSTMSSGNYLNSGRTPCYFTSAERMILGWMDNDLPDITKSGDYTLGPLSTNSKPYIIEADEEGECFLLEYRDGTGWDSFLPKGMVVYQDDSSNRLVADGYTAADLWINRSMNIYGDHACFRLVPAVAGNYSPEFVVFPGKGNVTDYVPVPWSGADLSIEINNIHIEGEQMKMTVTSSSLRRVWGYVKDTDGKPLEGATVQLGVQQAPATAPASAGTPAPRSTRLTGEEVRYTATTEADGSYQIFLKEDDQTTDFRLSVFRNGYIERFQDITLGRRAHLDFTLRPVGSPAKAHLQQFESSGQHSYTNIGYGTDNPSMMGAAYFSAEELSAYAGMQIKSVSLTLGSAVTSVHLLIDTEGERLLTKDITSQAVPDVFTEIDLSDQKLYIQPGTGMYFGYAGFEAETGFPVRVQKLEGAPGMYYAGYNLESRNWYLYGEGQFAMMLSVTLYDDAALKYLTLGSLDVNSIDNPKRESGYVAGDVFTFKLVEADKDKPSAVAWYYDGVAQSGDSVTLTSGTHTVKAHLSFPDGGQEDILLELKVQ